MVRYLVLIDTAKERLSLFVNALSSATIKKAIRNNQLIELDRKIYSLSIKVAVDQRVKPDDLTL